MFVLGTEVNTTTFDTPTEQSIKFLIYNMVELFRKTYWDNFPFILEPKKI